MPAALIGLALGLIGEGVKAVGDIKAAGAQRDAASAVAAADESQAELSDYNANVAKQQAQDALDVGAQQENQYRTQVRTLIGSQRAGFAANNVDVGFGSAVDTTADAAKLGELDALQIRTNAARQAWGFNVQAQDLTTEAGIQRKQGAAAIAAGNAQATGTEFNAATSVLGGTSSLLMAKYGFGNT
jgi:hypothetical protein